MSKNTSVSFFKPRKKISSNLKSCKKNAEEESRPGRRGQSPTRTGSHCPGPKRRNQDDGTSTIDAGIKIQEIIEIKVIETYCVQHGCSRSTSVVNIIEGQLSHEKIKRQWKATVRVHLGNIVIA